MHDVFLLCNSSGPRGVSGARMTVNVIAVHARARRQRRIGTYTIHITPNNGAGAGDDDIIKKGMVNE